MAERTSPLQRQKLLETLNTALSFARLSNNNEDEIYKAFGEQLEKFDLLGGLAFFNEASGNLVFNVVARSKLKNILAKYQRFSEANQNEFAVILEDIKIFQQVIETGEAVFVENLVEILRSVFPDLENALADQVLADFENWPLVSCPLVIEGEICGVMNVAGKELQRGDIHSLQTLANYVSSALTNARLTKKLKMRKHTYKDLFENLPIGIYRVDKDGKFLMANPAFLDIFGLKEYSEMDGGMINSDKLKPLHDRSKIIGKLVETGRIVGEETKWKNSEGEVVYFKENISASYDEDGSVLYYEGSVEDITNRINTEERLKQQLDEMLLLNEIAAAGASSPNVDEFLEQVTEILSRTIFSEHFGVILMDRSINKLRVHRSYRGLPPEFFNYKFNVGEGVTGKVFELGHPLRIADVREFDVYISSDPTLRSELCVPIKASGQVLGVLNAERAAVDAFSDDDEILLTTIAGQLATVLERAKFIDEVENKANQLSLLNQATLTTSRILEPDELIQLIAKQIINLLNPDSFLLTLFDENSEEIEIAIAVEKGEVDRDKSGVRIPMTQGGLTALLRDTGQVLQIDDLEHSPLLVGYKQFTTEMRGSWLGIPLISGKKILGALTVQYYEIKEFENEQTQFLESLAAHAAIAINNGRLFNEIQTRYELNNHLAKLSEDLNRPQTFENVVETIGRSSISLVKAEMAAVYVRQGDEVVCPWSHELSSKYTNAFTQGIEPIPGNNLLQSQTPLLIPDVTILPEGEAFRKLAEAEGVVSIALWPMVYEGQTIAALGCYRREPYTYTEDENEVMMAFARQAAVSLENARLLEAERSKRMEAEALYKTTLALTSSLDIEQVLSNILVELYRVIDYYSASLHLLEGDTVRVVAAEGLELDLDDVIGFEYSSEAAMFTDMLRTRRPIILEDAQKDNRFQEVSEMQIVRGWIGVPLIVGDEMIGCLTIDSDQEGAFSKTHATQAVAFANQAAIAIETARLFSQTQGRLQVLQSIHTIDQAISGNLDLSITLEVFMEQVINLLDVEAIKVYAHDADAQMYDLLGQRDLVANRPKPKSQFYNPTRVEEAVSQRVIVVDVNGGSGRNFSQAESPSYFVSPLITKGQVRGVLEVFGSANISINDEWLDLLRTLSTQAAIAIENAELITSLQKSNDELVAAYDRTLEGWAYALELRDRETIGHARRVTELTVKLARMMGITGIELANIRRGTLLHDIGKMGLPDSVLLKDGPLTKEEEKMMQTHPQLAYDMLSSIPYLKQALVIPYYHHEKWNGTGYPHGLKGEEIPLAARIFSVVDVWDAVIYDRPYRGAWDRQKAIDYIKNESGKHFDPRVVKMFLELIQ